MARNQEIAALLCEHRRLKAALRGVRAEMVQVAVEHLGLDQRDALQADLPVLLDGYLIGQGVKQKWRGADPQVPGA